MFLNCVLQNQSWVFFALGPLDLLQQTLGLATV